MPKINDGGQAFPHTMAGHPNYAAGMNLWDYAAIHADISDIKFESLDAVLDFIGIPKPAGQSLSFDDLLRIGAAASAKCRYIAADAMLAERAKGGGQMTVASEITDAREAPHLPME